jgi:hypothetical protein
MACRLYHACNANSDVYVTETFYEWYYIWQRSRYKPHLFQYYNMHVKKFVCINGSCLNQLEPVLPEVSVMEFGIGDTGCPQLIRGMLDLVRAEVYPV